MYRHQTRQQHVFIPADHKALSNLWPRIIEIGYFWEGGVLVTVGLRAVEEIRYFSREICQGREDLTWLYPGLHLSRAEPCGEKKGTTESSTVKGVELGPVCFTRSGSRILS